MFYYESPIPYMGNKYKLLRQLLPLFPEKCDTFYDLFGGSGVVSMNYRGQCKTVYNEFNPIIVSLIGMIRNSDVEELDKYFKEKVRVYNLRTQSDKINYDRNAEGYYRLRNEYNSMPPSERNPRDLYLLICYSIYHIIRFNSDNQFNVGNGSDGYNERNFYRLKSMQRLFKNVEIWNKNVFDIDLSVFSEDDFVYCDPPYSSTTAVYNEERAFGHWDDMESDKRLFDLLSKLTERNIKWGLSNVFACRGKVNKHLIEWCDNNSLIVVHLEKDYNPFSRGSSNSDEVYICNYRPRNLTTSLF